MTMACLKILLFLIVVAFHTSSTATVLDSKGNTSPLPVTTSKESSVLRDILNQESLVRLSVVQRMQSLTMDEMDSRKKVDALAESLKSVTEKMQILKAENQRQKDELTVLKEAHLNLEEDVRQLKIAQANDSSELLSFKKNHLDFSLAVNETFEQMRYDKNASDTQLLNFTSQVHSGESGTVLLRDGNIQILFQKPFEENPSMIYGLVSLDLNKYLTFYVPKGIEVDIINLTRSGFSISSTGVSGSNKLSWMACGK